MTSKAARCSIHIHLQAHSLFQVLGRFRRMARSNIKRIRFREVTQTALKIRTVFLEDIRLPILESEGPNRGKRIRVDTVRRAESYPFRRSCHGGVKAALLKSEPAGIRRYIGIGSPHTGVVHCCRRLVPRDALVALG